MRWSSRGFAQSGTRTGSSKSGTVRSALHKLCKRQTRPEGTASQSAELLRFKNLPEKFICPRRPFARSRLHAGAIHTPVPAAPSGSRFGLGQDRDCLVSPAACIIDNPVRPSFPMLALGEDERQETGGGRSDRVGLEFARSRCPTREPLKVQQ